MLTYFLELACKTDNKPFECVGTVNEVLFVINNLIEKWKDNLPYLLSYYKENYGVSKLSYEILTHIDENNNVPEELLKLVVKELNND